MTYPPKAEAEASWVALAQSVDTDVIAVAPEGYSYGADLLRAVEQVAGWGTIGAVVIEADHPALIVQKRFISPLDPAMPADAEFVRGAIAALRRKRETGITVLFAKYLTNAVEGVATAATNRDVLGVVRLSYASFRIRPEIRDRWIEAKHRGQIDFVPLGVRMESDPVGLLKDLRHRLERCSSRCVLVTADCYDYVDGFLADCAGHIEASGANGVVCFAKISDAEEALLRAHPELLFARGVFSRSWLRMICDGLSRAHSTTVLFDQIVSLLQGGGLSSCEEGVAFIPPARLDLDVNSFTAVGKRFVCRGSSESAFIATSDAAQSSEQILERVGQAVGMLHRNENQPALQILTEVAPLMPDLHDVVYAKAIAELRLGMVVESVRSLQLLIRRAPHHAQGVELLKQLRQQGIQG